MSDRASVLQCWVGFQICCFGKSFSFAALGMVLDLLCCLSFSFAAWKFSSAVLDKVSVLQIMHRVSVPQCLNIANKFF